MKELPQFSSADRIFILAPHPDDECLGSGVLIQKALTAGAKIRVVFATDGDNNPWPQRMMERRWKIDAGDRARWGSRRREEALSSLRVLGAAENCARFLGMPDQGINRLLMNQNERILEALVSLIDGWKPTHLVIPSALDLHPDHTALYVLMQFALDRLQLDANSFEELSYIIHSRGRSSRRDVVQISASDQERAKKRAAILCHTTQMALSQKRFLSFARPVELFHRRTRPTGIDARHPIRRASLENGALKLHLHAAKSVSTFKNSSILLAMTSVTEGEQRWLLPMPSKTGRVHIRDATTGAILRFATVRIRGKQAEVNLPIAPVLPLARLFVKLERRRLFYDEAGWREVPVRQKNNAEHKINAVPSNSGYLKNP